MRRPIPAAKPKDGRPKGCAHVDFSTQEEAIRVMENNTKKAYRLWDRAELLLDYATPLVKPQFPPHYTLFAPGVEGEEEDVRALFKDHEKNIRKVVLRTSSFITPILRFCTERPWQANDNSATRIRGPPSSSSTLWKRRPRLKTS